jgi:hypothetical protein
MMIILYGGQIIMAWLNSSSEGVYEDVSKILFPHIACAHASLIYLKKYLNK